MDKCKEFRKKIKKEKAKIIGIQLIVAISFLLIWELLARYNIINSFLFSSPSKIIKLLIENIKSKEIFIHIRYSLIETLIGLIIGTAIGIICAIILYLFKTLYKIFDPFLVILNALPKTALAPILIVWAGTGMKGIITVAISLSVIMTIISAHNFFNSVDEEKVKMLKTFNASRLQIFFKLVLPSNILNLISILKINIGLTWVGVIVGEFLVSRFGIGYIVVYGGQVFKMDLVMMGILVLAILTFFMYLFVILLEKILKRKEK